MLKNLIGKLLDIRGPRYKERPTVIDLSPEYRETVVNLLPPLYKNREVVEKITSVVGTDKVVVRTVHALVIMPWNAPSKEAVGIKDAIRLLEGLSYDMRVTSIEVVPGVFPSGKQIFGIGARDGKNPASWIEVFPVKQ